MSKQNVGYSKTILIGRLGANPTLKDKDSAIFPILNTTIVDGKEKVQSNTVLVRGKQKELCMKHLIKGDLCCIEGKLNYENYGNGKMTVLAEQITFLSNRSRESFDKENAND